MKKLGRVTGALYLIMFLASMFSLVYVSGQIKVVGDAAATFANIQEMEGLYRWGLMGQLVILFTDAAVAILFYIMLKSVNPVLAKLMAVFRLIMVSIRGINLLNLCMPLILLANPALLGAFDPAAQQASFLLFWEAFDYGFLIDLVFFGIHMILLGYLIQKSALFPRLLGIAVWVAGIAYLLSSFSAFVLPDYAELIENINTIPIMLGELGLLIWLLIKGALEPDNSDL